MDRQFAFDCVMYLAVLLNTFTLWRIKKTVGYGVKPEKREEKPTANNPVDIPEFRPVEMPEEPPATAFLDILKNQRK